MVIIKYGLFVICDIKNKVIKIKQTLLAIIHTYIYLY